jgi:hypothetical protein
MYSEIYEKSTGRFLKTIGPYYTVLSTKFGECGHDHKTKSAAEPCLQRMKRKLTEIRKAAAAKGLKTKETRRVIDTPGYVNDQVVERGIEA